MAQITLSGTYSNYAFDPMDASSVVAEGGMGIVFIGEDVVNNQRVAIKVIYRELAQNPRNIQRARKEADLGIDHPNIIRMLDYIERDGIYHVISEYLDGNTLEEYIKEKGALSVPETLDILLKVLHALDFLHNNTPKIIHRDIKPSNIFLCNNGLVKIMDFGIARITDGRKKSITGMGTVIGSIHYSPPEQVKGRQDLINETSDIYSLGITVYEMLTGEVPFDSNSEYEVLEMQIGHSVPDHPEIEPDLMEVIKKATEKEQDNRYQSAREMIASVEQLLKEMQVMNEQNNPSETDLKEEQGSETVIQEPADNPGRTRNPEYMVIPLVFAVIFFFSGIFFFIQFSQYKGKTKELELKVTEQNKLINAFKSNEQKRIQFMEQVEQMKAAILNGNNIQDDQRWGDLARAYEKFDQESIAAGCYTIAFILNNQSETWNNKRSSEGSNLIMALSAVGVNDSRFVADIARRSRALRLPGPVTNSLIMYGLFLDPNHPTLYGDRRIY